MSSAGTRGLGLAVWIRSISLLGRGANGYKKSPEGCWPSGRIGGGYLLFHFRSIIGVARFNFSVRNGKRWSPCAIATLVFFICALADVEGGKRGLEASSCAPRGDSKSCATSVAAVKSSTARSCLGLGRRSTGHVWGTCVPERVWVISIARL